MKPRIIHQLMLLALSLLMLSACKPQIPDRYLQPDEMEDLLYDYYLGRSMAADPHTMSGYEYRRQYNINLVLKKHGVTQAEMDSSLAFYYNDVEDLQKIYENVQERLRKTALDLGTSSQEMDRFTQQSLTGDTAEVWKGLRRVVLLPQPPYNIWSFSQKCDTSYYQGDSFLITLVGTFFVQNGPKTATLVLNVNYENDSTVTRTTMVSQSGVTSLRVPTSRLRAKEFKGYIYMGKPQKVNGQPSELPVLFIDQFQLVRFHQQKDDEKEEEDDVAKTTDNMRTDSLQNDSLKPRRHRLGERPVPMNPAPTNPVPTNPNRIQQTVKPITKK